MHSWNIFLTMFKLTVKSKIRSSLSRSWHLCQICRNSLTAFFRYRFHNRQCHRACDLWPPQFDQFILEFMSMSPQGTLEMARSRDVRLQWPLTFNHQNLISSSVSVHRYLCQLLQNSLTVFLRYHVHNMWDSGDLWPPKSNQVILESEWTFVQSLKNCPQRILSLGGCCRL